MNRLNIRDVIVTCINKAESFLTKIKNPKLTIRIRKLGPRGIQALMRIHNNELCNFLAKEGGVSEQEVEKFQYILSMNWEDLHKYTINVPKKEHITKLLTAVLWDIISHDLRNQTQSTTKQKEAIWISILR